jgi:peptidoglycan/xylan/chitin deacetylase (PgdA/CDA1 family)
LRVGMTTLTSMPGDIRGYGHAASRRARHIMELGCAKSRLGHAAARLRGALGPRRLARSLLGLPIGAILAWRLRLSSRRVGLAVLYHRVDVVRGDQTRELLPPLDARRFAAHVRHLRRRYRLVRASELLAATAGRRRGEPIPVTITFDDDRPDYLKTVAPILSRWGTPATIFLCGASLEQPFAFWWERLQRAFDRGVDVTSAFAGQPVERTASSNLTIHAAAAAMHELSPEAGSVVANRLGELLGADPDDAGVRAADVRALSAAGFEIGFHTREHHVLTRLDDTALEAALRFGRAELEGLVGRSLDLIAYPHGEVDQRVASAARAAGYRMGFATDREAVRPDSNPLRLGRYEPLLASPSTFAFDVARTLSAPRRGDG